jgi:O-antigen ligase
VPENRLLNRYWPAALVVVALVPPLFVSPAMHAELAIMAIVLGLGIAWLASLRNPPRVPVALVAVVAAFVGYLALRGAFAPEPVVALAGAYSSDGTIFSITAAAFAMFGLYAWPLATDDADAGRSARVAVFVAVALYAAVSGILAWQWGTTDPLGGPPSGLTPNSQYQLQLLTAGLAAAVAWGVTKRRNPEHVVAAVMVGAIIAINIQQCRSSVALPALVAAAAYAFVLWRFADRPAGRLLPAAVTAMAGVVGVGLTAALLAPSSSALIPLLDRLGNGRGTLWASSAQVFAANPLFGRGLNHATAITAWSLTPTSFTRVTTGDPHNIWFLIAVGGGVIGLGLLLALLYVLQRVLVEALRRTPVAERAALCVLIAGVTALVVLSQFSFMYPLAWNLALLLAGLAIARWPEKGPRERGSAKGMVVGASAVIVSLLLTGSIWLGLPSRAETTTVAMNTSWAGPAARLSAQLETLDHSHEVMAAENASALFSWWLAADRPNAEPYRPAFDERWALVAPNAVWDARIAVAALHLWSVDAAAGQAEVRRLEDIVDAGMEADPASGLWASAGAVFTARYGSEEDARRYAELVREDPQWWRQAQEFCDAGALAVLQSLIE